MKGWVGAVCAAGTVAFACVGSACADVAEPLESTVVFTQPNGAPTMHPFKTGRPEQTMPFGAGNLSAMVSFGTDTLELHLSRADYVLSARTDGVPGLPSPGHVSVRFPDLSLTGFRQELDVRRNVALCRSGQRTRAVGGNEGRRDRGRQMTWQE